MESETATQRKLQTGRQKIEDMKIRKKSNEERKERLEKMITDINRRALKFPMNTIDQPIPSSPILRSPIILDIFDHGHIYLVFFVQPSK